VEVGLAEVAVLAADGLAIGGGGSDGGEGGAAFGESSGAGAELEGEGFVEVDSGAVGEALELVDPVRGDGFDGGLLLAGPLERSGGGEAAIGGALHGFGELEADEEILSNQSLEGSLNGFVLWDPERRLMAYGRFDRDMAGNMKIPGMPTIPLGITGPTVLRLGG